MVEKRKREDSSNEQALVAKKQDSNSGALVTTNNGDASKQIQVVGVSRTSSLHAPIMQLVGHAGSIFGVAFSPDGQTLATASFDKTIGLWRVFGETCENYSVLKGHNNAVLDVKYSHKGTYIISASADRNVCVWDAETGARKRKFAEHRGIVNCCAVARDDDTRSASAGDDGAVKIWDARQRRAAQTISHSFPLTALTFGPTGGSVIAGGIDNVIRVYDLRKDGEVNLELRGHDDTISGLALAPNGGDLLSNSLDCTLRQWDVRPFSTLNERCVRTFMGHEHSVDKNLLRCCWSRDGTHVAAGSSDRMVYVWNVTTTKIVYRLPGHNACVNDVAFHPQEPILASASSDKTVFLGEIEE